MKIDNNTFEDESAWASLFDMADTYEEISDEIPMEELEGFNEVPEGKELRFNTPEEALKVLFGYDSFRQGQKSIIDSILSGRDAFAVMPTGAG